MGAAGGAAASELAELRKTKHIGGAIGGGAALGAAGLAAYARHKVVRVCMTGTKK
jgi:hypothetical protein